MMTALVGCCAALKTAAVVVALASLLLELASLEAGRGEEEAGGEAFGWGRFLLLLVLVLMLPCWSLVAEKAAVLVVIG